MASEGRALIVAYGDGNRAIGYEGRIPWLGRLPADMRRVRQLTTGQAVIMGLNTFRSIGRPLPERQNIVLAGNDFAADGVTVMHSLAAAFAAVEPGRTAFVFGGASVYAQSLKQGLIDEIYATEVHGKFRGDVFFPEIPAADWRETARQDFSTDGQNAFPYSFVKYERSRHDKK